MTRSCGAACADGVNSAAAHACACAACVTAPLRAIRDRSGAHSFAGGFPWRALLSRHNRNRPDATTTAEPTTSETVGTSPQIVNRSEEHTSELQSLRHL